MCRIPGLSFAKRITGKILESLYSYKYISLCGARYTCFDLTDLDARYRRMHQNHFDKHAGLIREMQERKFTNILEVACGTGCNIQNFQDIGLEYTGLDISETAIAMAMIKYPANRYINLGICDCKMIRDESFDVVYSSSMLEHIGYYKEAIMEMVRLAKKEVWILFFEGLSSDDDHKVDFHPYTETEISGVDKDIFGRKVVLQDHIHEKNKGWYWNRYSKKKIMELFEVTTFRVEIMDKTNRPFMGEETMLIIIKA